MLLSEQNLRFASPIANRALIIEKGRIRYQGTLAELTADETGPERLSHGLMGAHAETQCVAAGPFRRAEHDLHDGSAAQACEPGGTS